MKEYLIFGNNLDKLTEAANDLAKDGWRIHSMSATPTDAVLVMERDAKEHGERK